MDYIFIYCEEYSTNLQTSKHQLIKYLKKNNNRILYFESSLSIFSIFKYFRYFIINIKKFFSYIKNDNLIITSSINILPFHSNLRLNLFNRINQKINVHKINSIIKKYNFNNIQLLIFSPLLGNLSNKISNVNKTIFIINDDYSGFDKNTKSLEKYILYFLNQSNLVIYNSRPYFRYIVKKYNLSSLNHYKFAPHGIDKNKLEKYRKKKLYFKKNLNFFYYGQLSKIDFQIIENIAKEFTNYKFHIIGPMNKISTQSYNLKKTLNKNIFFYDSLEKDELLKTIFKFDIAILPFKFNNLTEYMLPIKIYELIFLNIPIITTKNITIYEEFNDDLLYLDCNNIIGSFDLCVRNILKNQKLNSKSNTYTWEEIFKEFYHL